MGAWLCLCQKSDNDNADQMSVRSSRLEKLLQQLFRRHDLNSNGVLEEVELVKLNEKIALLHSGSETDRGAIRKRYSGIFRSRLDADGQPVAFNVFRDYMLGILDDLDSDLATQEMILEQLIAEADLALAVFPVSLTVRSGVLASLKDEQAWMTTSMSEHTTPPPHATPRLSPKKLHAGVLSSQRSLTAVSHAGG
mmetsp:Transcript_144857/g.266203  ORF Transcript_144857/g.266203 Transcript_144857/m.266203 type:complete len:195 (-) Transcript_144857:188-772(-)